MVGRGASAMDLLPREGDWNNHGEFDPGSERTLAARLKHASRAAGRLRAPESGGLVSSAWVTRPPDGDSPQKCGVIPDKAARAGAARGKGQTPRRGSGPRPISWTEG